MEDAVDGEHGTAVGPTRDVDVAALRALCPRVHRSYRRGDVLYRQGDRGAQLFVVMKGCVRLIGTDPATGQPGIVREARTGTFFGEAVCFGGDRRSATAVAAEDARVVAFGPDGLADLLRRGPTFTLGLIRALRDRVRREGAAGAPALARAARPTVRLSPGAWLTFRGATGVPMEGLVVGLDYRASLPTTHLTAPMRAAGVFLVVSADVVNTGDRRDAVTEAAFRIRNADDAVVAMASSGAQFAAQRAFGRTGVPLLSRTNRVPPGQVVPMVFVFDVPAADPAWHLVGDESPDLPQAPPAHRPGAFTQAAPTKDAPPSSVVVALGRTHRT